MAWQIDPFGHSREQASLFARFGFDGLFFGRLDWRDKDTRIRNKTMEVIWNAGYYDEDQLFTGVLYNYYSPPPNFCWDLLCNDEPMRSNPMLHDYNVDARADDFINYVLKAANAYRTNNVAITTGMDFHYQVIIYFGLGFCFLLDYDFCTLFRYFCSLGSYGLSKLSILS